MVGSEPWLAPKLDDNIDNRAGVQQLFANLKKVLPEFQKLLESCRNHWGYEDPLYRERRALGTPGRHIPRVIASRPWFDLEVVKSLNPSHAASPDGTFLINALTRTSQQHVAMVVLNWQERLRNPQNR